MYIDHCIIISKSLAPHCCGFESRQQLWNLSCEEAIQLAYRTLLVLLRCPLAPEIMQLSLPPPVKLESRNITFSVGVT